jgi:hypothetical protein
MEWFEAAGGEELRGLPHVVDLPVRVREPGAPYVPDRVGCQRGSSFPVNIPTLRTSVYRASRPAKAVSTTSSIAAVESNCRSKCRVQAGSSDLN